MTHFKIEFETYSANPLNYGASLYLNNSLVTDLVIPDGKKGHDSSYTVTYTKPTKENARFAGWSTEKNGKVEYKVGDICTINLNFTLYAVWHPVIKVSNKAATIGNNFELPITIHSNCGLAGLGLKITYHDAIELVSVTRGSALSSLDMTVSNPITANPINVNFDGVDADSTSGTVITLTFKAKEDAAEGSHNINIEVTNAHDNDMEDVVISTVTEQLT